MRTHRTNNRRRSIALACLLTAAVTVAGSAFAAPATTEPASLMHSIDQVVPNAVQPLSPADVKLTGGPLKKAQDLDADYLLKLEPDRMLALLRQRAGLPEKAQPYGGWDGDGRQLTGHICGHYLSAVSYMYRATGDERFKQRADYIVSQLAEIQQKQGDGYIGGLMGTDPRPATRPASMSSTTTQPTTRRTRRPQAALVDGKVLFEQLAQGQIRSGGFDLNGMWSPWYVQHKLFAGLRDAYRLTGNKQALEVEIGFGGWADSVIGNLTDAQAQKMMETEFGGMNEVLVDLYADTGDHRWLSLADKFEQHSMVDPLAKGDDILRGKHGNTNVPKLLGELVRFLYTGEKVDGDAAKFFWTSVVDHHSFATGGHGYDEYFGAPDQLSGQVDGTGQRSHSLRTAESCNVYNMLKMTRMLFALAPDVHYADFQERALYNHVLASIDPKNGRTCYMVPVGPGVIHEYQDMFDSFTCCVGTGMENHALHADGLYYANADHLYVAVYAPTVAKWQATGATLTMETDFPLGQSATMKVDVPAPKSFTISFRRPKWTGDGFKLAVNGQAVADLGTPDSFVDVTRTWAPGDVVTIALPETLHTDPLPDNPSRVALMCGPLVLAGDFGSQYGDDQGENARSRRIDFPVFVDADKPLTEWLKPVDGKPATFTATMADGKPITLSPFYALHERRYSLYWDLFTPAQWNDRQSAYAAQQSAQQAIAKATVGYFQPGEMQAERDFKFEADEASNPVRDSGQAGREGGKWMTLEAPIDPDQPVAVIISVRMPIDARPNFTLSFNDAAVPGEPATQMDGTSGLTDVIFRPPADATHGQKRGTLRLATSADNGRLPAIFGVRVVRANEVSTLPK